MSAAAGGPAVRRVVISSFDNPAHPHYQGGGVAVIEAMAGRLGEEFEVTVLTVGRRSESVLHNGIRYRRLPLEWAGPRAGQLVYHAVLPFAARRIRHDLWIENFTPPFSTSFLPLFLRTPVLGFAQALQGRELSRRYRFPFFLIERLGLRCYRDVLVLNAADQALVTAANPAAAVHLIPNGIQTVDLDETLLGSGEHVLFLGRIDVWKKGIDYLIEAYERSGMDLPLLIAGAGLPREERRLAELVARTSADVRWIGHVTGEPKRDLLERSAFVVMPSRYETFGLSALEAMAHAKPVLHFDLPTLGWMDGDIAVPAYDTAVLAEQMRTLAGDEPLRRELGRKAHAAAQKYGHDETAERYLALARKLLGRSGPRRSSGR
jgi:glycosyltransferase involved in cell wall biosynthesis